MNIDELNPHTARLLHDGYSELGNLKVYENGHYRWLSFENKQAHSAMSLLQPYQPVLPYYPVLLSSLLFQPQPDTVLLLGLGGGDLIRFFQHYLPDSHVSAVEISAQVIDVYQQYFQAASESKETLDILHMDVCKYMDKPVSQRFDLVYLDVFGEASLPDCLYQPGFYQKLYNMIELQGVVAVNFVVKGEADALRLMQLMYQGFEQHILCLSVGTYMNLVVLGFRRDPLTLPAVELDYTLQKLANQFEMNFDELLHNLLQNNPHLSQKIEKYFRL